MAIIEVKVPQLSESVAEATLLDWHKKEGEAVSRDENLIDIETDKVVLELPAPADGVLVKIVKANRASVGSGDVIAQIDTEAKAGASSSPLKTQSPPEKAKAAPAVMPAAQKIAAEKGIDTSKVQGTGRDSRVTKGDVLSQPEKRPLQQPPAPVNTDALLSGRPEQRVPMSRLRQRVAERLVQSQSTAAILTTFNEVNMAPVMEMRKKYQERFEKEHGTRFAEIEKKIGDFGKKAQDGKLAIEDLTGGTFSISNGGVFGSMLSTPIINPPQSAILGVHATKDRAVVENGQIVVRPINYLALSYDHRIIDGREAVLFLVSIKDALEDPSRIILEI
jgi:2-oxoglutarate dehydrogenase E2 component (dihydrolipoamide succinyltransferase)